MRRIASPRRVRCNSKWLSDAHSRASSIAAPDDEIDQLVYQLYGLTDKEIAIVEKATK
jgi:hypothetical protein